MITPKIHHAPTKHELNLTPPQRKQRDALVRQTEKWVAASFYGTLLKQMRNSPFKSEIFDGGRGGQAFSEMFDQKLADRMSHGSAHKLVNAVVNHIERSQAAALYARQSSGSAGGALPAPSIGGDGNPSGGRDPSGGGNPSGHHNPSSNHYPSESQNSSGDQNASASLSGSQGRAIRRIPDAVRNVRSYVATAA